MFKIGRLNVLEMQYLQNSAIYYGTFYLANSSTFANHLQIL